MAELRMDALAALAEQRQHVALLVILEDEQMLESFPPSARYFLGEAYRLRNAEGDLERAGEEMSRATREAPDFAPAWRGLGLHLMRHGDDRAAADALETYLALVPEATDAAFIENYITNLRAAVAASEGEKP
jgi:Flp pilus assembly protein TadD